VLKLAKCVHVKGISHITGGGMIENIPRMFPEDKNLGVYIDTESWKVPNIFDWLQDKGDIDIHEMRRVFNMGIGMILIVSVHDVDEAKKIIPDIKVLGEVYYRKQVSFI
jgi:phosphoribosylformylglycinamidine cyclo-ligase